jgi:hypothetical protein
MADNAPLIVGLVLDRLGDVKQSGNGWTARCPAHDDRHASLSISQGENGRVLLCCHTGCKTEQIVSALGMKMSDLFEGKKGAPGQGLTLAAYAEAKGLPIGFLKDLGVKEGRFGDTPVVRIPYKSDASEKTPVRLRLALTGKDRFRWRKGDKAALYGLWRLREMVPAGYVLLVEGESDVHTAWYHDVPAIGLPSASGWRDEYATLLRPFKKVYAVIEPDQGGQKLLETLKRSPLLDRLYRVDLGDAKDVSDLYLRDRAAFKGTIAAALDAAIPVADQEATELEAKAADIIACSNVLDHFRQDWSKIIAGEEKNAAILFLVATSRLFDKAMHAVIKGPSSSGKSEVRHCVLKFFPPEDVFSFTSLSERALIYYDGDFTHKILSMGEASGTDEQAFQDYLLRELMSEGRLTYPTVQKVGNEMVTRVICKEGPVSFLVTTTRNKLHAENETRMISVEMDDSEVQTRAVLAKVAEVEGLNAAVGLIDFDRWRDFQRWLRIGERRVVVPFAKDLARFTPPRAVRLRRDFGQVLRAIKAHALLHRNHRERDDRGHIVADIDHDYRAVRGLMEGLLAEISGVKMSDTVAETIEAVRVLTKDLPEDQGVTAVAVGRHLKLDKSAAGRRLSKAVGDGLVVNLESRKYQAGRFRLTGETIETSSMMPAPEALKRVGAPQPPCNPCNPATAGQKSAGTQGVEGLQNPVAPGLQPSAGNSGCTPPATALATAENGGSQPKMSGGLRGSTGCKGEPETLLSPTTVVCLQCGQIIGPCQQRVSVAGRRPGEIHEDCYDAWFRDMRLDEPLNIDLRAEMPDFLRRPPSAIKR